MWNGWEGVSECGVCGKVERGGGCGMRVKDVGNMDWWNSACGMAGKMWSTMI